MADGQDSRAGLGKLTWEQQFPRTFVSFPTQTAKQLKNGKPQGGVVGARKPSKRKASKTKGKH
jgi:hypothetical protein